MERIDVASIGRRVAAYRRDIGMTADELARELGPSVTGNAVTKLERGHRAQMPPELLVDLARVLGVSPLALLFPLDDPNAEIVVAGMRGTVRSFGQWLLGNDVTTATFRQLVAVDTAVRQYEKSLGRASENPDPRETVERRDEQEALLRILEADLHRQRDSRATPRGKEAIIARVGLSEGKLTVTLPAEPPLPSSGDADRGQAHDGVDQPAS